MEILAERMKMLRKEKHLSQKEAAEVLEISFSAYCRYEYGEREPAASTIAAMARLFRVSADFLLGLTDER